MYTLQVTIPALGPLIDAFKTRERNHTILIVYLHLLSQAEKEVPLMSVSTIAETVGIGKSSTYNAIRILVKLGLVVFPHARSRDKVLVYTVLEPEQALWLRGIAEGKVSVNVDTGEITSIKTGKPFQFDRNHVSLGIDPFSNTLEIENSNSNTLETGSSNSNTLENDTQIRPEPTNPISRVTPGDSNTSDQSSSQESLFGAEESNYSPLLVVNTDTRSTSNTDTRNTGNKHKNSKEVVASGQNGASPSPVRRGRKPAYDPSNDPYRADVERVQNAANEIFGYDRKLFNADGEEIGGGTKGKGRYGTIRIALAKWGLTADYCIGAMRLLATDQWRKESGYTDTMNIFRHLATLQQYGDAYVNGMREWKPAGKKFDRRSTHMAKRPEGKDFSSEQF